MPHQTFRKQARTHWPDFVGLLQAYAQLSYLIAFARLIIAISLTFAVFAVGGSTANELALLGGVAGFYVALEALSFTLDYSNGSNVRRIIREEDHEIAVERRREEYKTEVERVRGRID